MSDTSWVENDLAQFDTGFKPQAGKRPGLDSLPDGEYDFEIVNAEMAKTPKTGDSILRQSLRVISVGPYQGNIVERAYFFKSQANIDILGADLCTLGLDADQWKAPSRPMSKELPKALPRLVGLRFRGKKVTNGEYANLYTNSLLPKSSASVPNGGYAEVPVATGTSKEIPF